MELTGYQRVHEVLERSGLNHNSSGWQCPAHGDNAPSMSVKEGKEGRALLKCHAGCALEDIVAKLGLEMTDLFTEDGGGKSEIVATYSYLDEQGVPLYEVVRFSPKDFRQRLPNGEWKLNGVRKVPYRLPQVLEAAKSGRPVYIVEGEKDVHAIEKAGGVATCNSGGAEKWRPDFAPYFSAADVIVVADKDAAGARHAEMVRASVEPVAKSVQIVQAAVGKDAYDHLAAGQGLENFQSVSHDEQVDPGGWVTGDALLQEPPPPPPGAAWYPVEGGEALIREGYRYLMWAAPGSGKSYLGLAACIETALKGGVGVYLDWEGSERVFKRRLHSILVGTPGRGLVSDERIAERIYYRRMWEPVGELVLPTGTRHVTIDAIAESMAMEGLSEDSAGDFSTWVNRIWNPIQRQFPDASILALDHPGHEGNRARGTSNKRPQVDVDLSLKPAGKRISIRSWKDRHGIYGDMPPGSVIGEAQHLFGPDGSVVITVHEANTNRDEDGNFRPSYLMERVSMFMEMLTEPTTKTVIVDEVEGKAQYLRSAVDYLVREGYVENTGSSGRPELRLVKPFRETA